jgi:hypothetical protein
MAAMGKAMLLMYITNTPSRSSQSAFAMQFRYGSNEDIGRPSTPTRSL